MYVRWKRRKLTRRLRDGSKPGYSLYAVLVKSERINGRPRQRVVKHLGSFREKEILSVIVRDYFWRRIEAKLSKLDLDPDTRSRVEARLSQTIPRPSQAEKDKEVERAMKRIRQLENETGLSLL